MKERQRRCVLAVGLGPLCGRGFGRPLKNYLRWQYCVKNSLACEPSQNAHLQHVNCAFDSLRSPCWPACGCYSAALRCGGFCLVLPASPTFLNGLLTATGLDGAESIAAEAPSTVPAQGHMIRCGIALEIYLSAVPAFRLLPGRWRAQPVDRLRLRRHLGLRCWRISSTQLSTDSRADWRLP